MQSHCAPHKGHMPCYSQCGQCEVQEGKGWQGWPGVAARPNRGRQRSNLGRQGQRSGLIRCDSPNLVWVLEEPQGLRGKCLLPEGGTHPQSGQTSTGKNTEITGHPDCLDLHLAGRRGASGVGGTSGAGGHLCGTGTPSRIASPAEDIVSL